MEKDHRSWIRSRPWGWTLFEFVASLIVLGIAYGLYLLVHSVTGWSGWPGALATVIFVVLAAVVFVVLARNIGRR
jgi:hypothetical protein